jgi:hypothetical protein
MMASPATIARLAIMIICPRPAARFVWERWPAYFRAYRLALVADARAFRRGEASPPPAGFAGRRPRGLRVST